MLSSDNQHLHRGTSDVLHEISRRVAVPAGDLHG